MPDFSFIAEDPGFSDRTAISSLTPDSIRQNAKIGNPGSYGTGTIVAGSAALGFLDLADTVASSIPVISRSIGVSRGDINEKMLQTLDMPGVSKFYRENKGAVEIASGIYGIIGAELATRKLTAAAAPLMAGLKSTSWGKRALSLDEQYQRSMVSLRTVDRKLAEKGLLGGQAYVQSVLTPVTKWDSATKAFKTTQTLMGRAQAQSRVSRLAFAKGAKEALKVEGIMAATLNQNSFLYDDDLATNVLQNSIGLGAAGLFETLASRYAMRRWNNADQLNRLRAESLDPTGIEQAILGQTDQFRLSKKDPNSLTFLGSFQGANTDLGTAYMVMAKATPKEGIDPSAWNQIKIAREEQAFLTLEKVFQKGLVGDSQTKGIIGFGADKVTPEGRQIKQLLDRDPGALQGVEMLGKKNPEKNLTQTIDDVKTGMDERLKEIQDQLDFDQTATDAKKLSDEARVALRKESKNLRLLGKKLTPMVIMNGERLPSNFADLWDGWTAPIIRESNSSLGPDIKNFEVMQEGGKKTAGIGVDSSLQVYLPKNKAVGGLDFYDSLRLYRVTDRATSNIANRMVANAEKTPLKLRDKSNWFELDAALEVARKVEESGGTPNIDWGRALDGTLLTRETAEKEALAQKVDVLKDKIRFGKNVDETQIHKWRIQLNLPQLSAYQMGLMGTQSHPIDVILKGAMASGGGQAIRDMTVTQVKEAIAAAKVMGDLSETLASDIKTFRGKSFQFGLDDAGQETAPLIAFVRPIKDHAWVKDSLVERLAINKLNYHAALVGTQSSDYVRNLAQNIYNSPDFILAGKVNEVSDLQLQSSVPGLGNAAPNSPIRAVADNINPFMTSTWRARDSAPLRAVIRLRDQVDRFTRGYAKARFEEVFQDRLVVLNGPRSQQSRLLLDQFHTPGVVSGWDLEDAPIDLVENNQNLKGFVLSDTAHNRARFKEQFDREMDEGQQLLGPNGKPVVLDDLGWDIQQRLNQLTDEQRINKNVVLRANGLPEISRTAHYVPPPNVEGKYIAYTFNSAGKIVPGGTIIAKTQAELDSRVAKLKADPNSVAARAGNMIRGRKEIEAFGNLWDKAQMDMINANTTAIQGGRRNVGSTAAEFIQGGSFQSGLEQVNKNYLASGGDMIETIYKDQLAAATHRSQLAASETKAGASFWQSVKSNSVYDYWLQEAKGMSPLSSTGNPVAAIYNPTEAWFNRVMESAAPKASEVFHAATDWATKRLPWSQGVADKKSFEQLSAHLGKYMPFESAAVMVAARDAGAKAFTTSEITGNMNKFAATWILRMFETGHPIMNLGGVINAIPAVVRNYTPKAGESMEQFAARVGHSANIFSTPTGATFGTLDMSKLAARGAAKAWKKESNPLRMKAARMGMLGQEVAEVNEMMSFLSDRGSVGRFFNGDPSGDSWLKKKGMVGAVSVLSDKSEDFSREWAFWVGAELAEQIGIRNEDHVIGFAHDIANQMIANYNPHNRSSIYQGAIGALPGLFSSYMVNFWQRMFRYVETGELRTAAVQMAMQGGLFGATTMPGFQQLNNFIFNNSDGQEDLIDGITSRFGPGASDFVMMGTLSTLPKLFGAEGIDFSSRGDVEPRLPLGVFSNNDITNSVPAFSILAKVQKGIGEAAGLFADNHPGISAQQIGEILSNMIPNRPLAGMVETFMAGGMDTDSYGQLVSENLSAMENVYRVMGMRSIRQSKELDAFYQNKQAMELKAGQDEVLRKGSRSLIRGGREDALPQLFEAYVTNGGDPRHFKRWYNQNYEAATETRGYRQLQNVMNDPDKMYMAQRLMDMEVGIREDDEMWDPYDTLTMQDPMDDPLAPRATPDDPGYAYGMNLGQ